MNWIYSWLRSKLADGQVLGRSGNGFVGFDVTGRTLAPTADDTYDLGATGSRWRKLVLGLGGIQIGLTDSSGTPGAATINRPAGKVAIDAGASSVVVTNSLVTAASLVFCVLQTADGTLTTIRSVVPGSGSFTVTGNANATAATKVAFLVINPSA